MIVDTEYSAVVSYIVLHYFPAIYVPEKGESRFIFRYMDAFPKAVEQIQSIYDSSLWNVNSVAYPVFCSSLSNVKKGLTNGNGKH